VTVTSERGIDWRPGAGWSHLRRRAEIVASLRTFFAERGVLEVETPMLGSATVSDPHLQAVACTVAPPGAAAPARLYLQTSPESAMKRLLAADSGPIFQISKAFRDGEAGRMHNPEFTMLEWYRPGFDHHRLMDELDELMALVLGTPPADRITYREAFLRHVGVDPFTSTVDELRSRAAAEGCAVPSLGDDHSGWLDLLAAALAEPRLGTDRPLFVFDYPVHQASLARIRPGSPPVAERFELFVGGVELANGYHELRDADEQHRRYLDDLERRRRLGLPTVDEDQRLLGALRHGLPACAGVALGVDRLVMLATGATSIDEVIAFTVTRA
jgi:lysyl-tRNA synthetase class 2